MPTISHRLSSVYPVLRRVHYPREAIVEVMDACMQELRRSRHVDTSELTVEAGLFKSFDRILQRQLDPVWHMAGGRAREMGRVGGRNCSDV